jgi:endonuclease-3
MQALPPSPTEVTAVLSTLYGAPEWSPRVDPVSELVACILSQHTSDANSIPAFERLRSAYPSWQALLGSGDEAVASLIRSSGFANQKARRIRESLTRIRELRGEFDLSFLSDLPLGEARAWLMALPGIGPKCAAIVLCFALGMPAIPVDTHVFRVGWRLGYYDRSIGEAKAHEVLQDLVPPEIVFAFHVGLINHGRHLCKAQRPRCPACPLRSQCRHFASSEQDNAGAVRVS